MLFFLKNLFIPAIRLSADASQRGPLWPGDLPHVATVPTGISFAALNILAANDNATDATLRVWIGTDATPSQADLVEPGVVIGGKGRYEDSVRIASPPSIGQLCHCAGSAEANRVAGILS